MKIREMTKADTEAVVETLSLAFENEALYAYFIPDAAARAAFVRRFLRFRLRYGLKKGRVFVTDDCSGVAIWIRPGQSMTPFDLIRYGGLAAMLRCDKDARGRLMSFSNFADEQQAKVIAQPFWHLSPIAVRPDCQGRGLGTALMEQGLQMIRESGTPCYLETQTEQNRKFYQALGCTLKQSVPVPGAGFDNISLVFVP